MYTHTFSLSADEHAFHDNSCRRRQLRLEANRKAPILLYINSGVDRKICTPSWYSLQRYSKTRGKEDALFRTTMKNKLKQPQRDINHIARR